MNVPENYKQRRNTCFHSDKGELLDIPWWAASRSDSSWSSHWWGTGPCSSHNCPSWPWIWSSTPSPSSSDLRAWSCLSSTCEYLKHGLEVCGHGNCHRFLYTSDRTVQKEESIILIEKGIKKESFSFRNVFLQHSRCLPGVLAHHCLPVILLDIRIPGMLFQYPSSFSTLSDVLMRRKLLVCYRLVNTLFWESLVHFKSGCSLIQSLITMCR